jgi:hypothetical protein
LGKSPQSRKKPQPICVQQIFSRMGIILPWRSTISVNSMKRIKQDTGA